MALQAKHKQALVLLQENKLSKADIAKACGMSYKYLIRLTQGESTTGEMGKLFQSEVRKVYQAIDKRTHHNIKDTKDLAIKEMKKYLMANKDSPDPRVIKRVIEINNSLSKSTPHIQIDSLKYTRGLSVEDLINEFKRLSTVAKASLIRVRVPGSGERGSGELPISLGSRDTVQQESEDPSLPATPSPEKVSPE